MRLIRQLVFSPEARLLCSLIAVLTINWQKKKVHEKKVWTIKIAKDKINHKSESTFAKFVHAPAKNFVDIIRKLRKENNISIKAKKKATCYLKKKN